MKTFLIALVACTVGICSGETPVSGPYPPSGWRPDGPAFELPPQIQFQGVSQFAAQETQGAYLPPSEKSQGQASGSNEYGAPDSFDLSVQGLPGKESESTFRKSPLQSGSDKPYVNTFTKELRLLEEEKRKQAEQQNYKLNTGEQYNFESEKSTFNPAPQSFASTYQPSPVSSVQQSRTSTTNQQFIDPQNQQQISGYYAPENSYQNSYANAPVISKNQYDANLNLQPNNNFQKSQPQQENYFQYYQQQRNNFQGYDAPQEQNTFQNYETPQSQNTFQNYQPQQNDYQNYQYSQQQNFQNYKAPEQQNFKNTQDSQTTQGNSFQNYQTPQQNNLQNLQTSNQQASFNSGFQPQATFQNQQSFNQQNRIQNTQNLNQQRGFLNQREYAQPQEQQFSQNQASDNSLSEDQDQGFGVQASFDSRKGPKVSVTGYSGNQENQRQFSEYGVPRTVQEYGPPNTRSTPPSPVDDSYTTETNSFGDYDNSTDYNFGAPNVAISTAVSDGRGRRGSARLRSRRGQAAKSEQ